MPSIQEHVDWARHNRTFWNSFDLDATPYLDWVVTGIFYEAVHWIGAFLASKGDHPTSHPATQRRMQRYPTELNTVPTDWGILRADSENTRYECYMPNSAEVRNDLIPIIERIESHITGLVNPSP